MTKYNSEEALEALYSDNDDNENEHDPVHIIFHLKERMAERGITQMQLAEMAGVRQASISQLSRGNIEKLHIPTLERIALALDITDITKLLTFEAESEIMSGGNPFHIKYDNQRKG